MIQKSYENEKSNLYLVPTPIGNMEDITLRAINVLKNVDAIFAEDTRVTTQLLNNLNIKNKVYPCHKFNEQKASLSILSLLSKGYNIALVTDRGTPLISDPGNIAVKEVIKNNYNVIALPGASALLPALNMSNISSEKFLFYGFLNAKESQAKKELEMLKDVEFTIVLYEAPHRLNKTLQNIYKILGNKVISISREISKLHEEVFRGTVLEAIDLYDSPKGEFVIVIEANEKKDDYETALLEVNNYIQKGFSSKDAIKEVSKINNLSKNILYSKYEENKK